MGALRAQGRPRRGVAEVGREKIIARLQQAVRSSVELDLSRKTLSECAGVTPALISYYFPKKEMLLQGIANPIVRNYRLELEAIVAADKDRDAKVREIISLLVRLYSNDQRIMDIYVELAQRGSQCEACELDMMTKMLIDFFSSWSGGSGEDRFNTAVLQGAVWGMCRFAVRVDAETARNYSDPSPFITKVVNTLFSSLSEEPVIA